MCSGSSSKSKSDVQEVKIKNNCILVVCLIGFSRCFLLSKEDFNHLDMSDSDDSNFSDSKGVLSDDGSSVKFLLLYLAVKS